MRIFRHRDDEQAGRPEPAWVAGRPAASTAPVRIEAPKASDLARSDVAA